MENQSTPSPAPPPTRKRSHRLRGCLITVGIVVLLVILIAILSSTIRPLGQAVQAVTGQRLQVVGPTMEPTIHSGQSVYVRAYLGSAPARGDIIVFHPPNDPQALYVKRVIAIPGDTICVSPNAVTLNGSPLHEPYVLGGREVNPFAPGCLTLGSNRYFVMGDNRANSADSRAWGPVPLENIVGKVVGIFG